MSKISNFFDKITESQTFLDIKSKYDALDATTKLYVQIGCLASVVGVVALSLIASIARLNSIKNEIHERETLIGFLQQSADNIKQLKASQDSGSNNLAMTMPLPQLIDSVLLNSGIDKTKIEVGSEKDGGDDKESKEYLTEIKFSQFNIKALVRLLFSVSEQGAFKTVSVKDLTINTKDDPKGYIEGNAVFSSHRPK